MTFSLVAHALFARVLSETSDVSKIEIRVVVLIEIETAIVTTITSTAIASRFVTLRAWVVLEKRDHKNAPRR